MGVAKKKKKKLCTFECYLLFEIELSHGHFNAVLFSLS